MFVPLFHVISVINSFWNNQKVVKNVQKARSQLHQYIAHMYNHLTTSLTMLSVNIFLWTNCRPASVSIVASFLSKLPDTISFVYHLENTKKCMPRDFIFPNIFFPKIYR